jgi:hypothetical protein
VSDFTPSNPDDLTEEGAVPVGPSDAVADEEDGGQEDGGQEKAGVDATSEGTDGAAARGRLRDRHPAAARAVAITITVAAVVLVLGAFLLPDKATLFTPTAFVRIPVEALLLGALLLALPPKARTIAGVCAGLGIVLLTLVKLLDLAFYSALDKPFDLMYDWSLIPDGLSAFSDSAGHTIAVLAVIGIAILILGLIVLVPLAVLRLGKVLNRHSRTATRTLLVLGAVWIICSVVVVRIPGGPQLATRNTAALAYENVQQVRNDIKDEGAFRKAAANDPLAAVPPDRVLTGLRGKNVIFAFVESYGRCAVQDPIIAPGVDAMLAGETGKLERAGFSSRSAFMTSATYGGSSWLGHSTFLSGLWVDNQSRYRTVTHSNRISLTAAFERTGAWRTVGVVPGTREAWPEAKWEGLDNVYDAHHLGYRGPNFSWSTMPDQYVLSAFQSLENGRPHDKPLMSQIVLTSSHAPWAPIPVTVPWDQVGDGTVYRPIEKAGKRPGQVWKHTSEVRAEYGRSIQYSVSNLIDYVVKYGNDDTVLVFLGDHQPASIVSGNHASRDVPVSIVAHDPDVMKRISGWGWQNGLRPDPKTAPVWKMSAFRDRFLSAYGPLPGSPGTR